MTHDHQPPDAAGRGDRIKPPREPAEWAKGRPARRFRVMMEPIARAILAEQERDEAEARLHAAEDERDELRGIEAAALAQTDRADAAEARADALAVALAEHRVMLRQVEWEGVSYEYETCSPACIVCLAPTAEGHRDACRLAVLLAADPEPRGRAVLEAARVFRVALEGPWTVGIDRREPYYTVTAEAVDAWDRAADGAGGEGR